MLFSGELLFFIKFLLPLHYKQNIEIMRKIYTLAIALIGAFAIAQTTTVETFDNASLTDQYSDGSFVGEGDVTWTYGHSRSQLEFEIDGAGIMLRRALDSYIEATIDGGVTELSFQYRKAHTGSSERQMELIINNEQIAVSEVFGDFSGEDASVFTLSVTDLNIEGTFTVRIKNVGDGDFNRQTIVDNITWTSYEGGVSVKDNHIAGLSVYPNPVSTGTLYITSDNSVEKAVAIFDVLGKQVVNATTANGTVNVSNLTAGVYIVKVTEEGKTATRKLVVK